MTLSFLDTDIHIPFFLRGPGITPGGSIDTVTTHTDVAATILQIAGLDKELDGLAIPLHPLDNSIARPEHASIEFWGMVSIFMILHHCVSLVRRTRSNAVNLQGVPEGIYGGKSDRHREAGRWSNYYANNTFKGLRIIADDYSLYYSVWCTNETEFFDLKVSERREFNAFFLSKKKKKNGQGYR